MLRLSRSAPAPTTATIPPCKSCRRQLLAGAKYCPYCGLAAPLPGQPKPRTGRVVYVLAAILVAVAALTSEPVIENVAVANANPDMVVLADDAGMNDLGKRLFLRNYPVLRSDISADCAGWLGWAEEGSPIDDGCYDAGSHRIFIRDLPEELNGYEVSTAAHEMLHVVYESLPEPEKQRLNELLQAEADKLKDEDLQERLDMYEAEMPGSTQGELHSILPTEYEKLSPELEEHYAHYFHDRQLAVKQDQRAKGHFTKLEQEIEAADKRITAGERAAEQARLLHAVAIYNGDKRRIAQYATQLAKAEAEVDRLIQARDDAQQKYDDFSAEYGAF